MWVSSLFLWSVSLAAFWLIERILVRSRQRIITRQSLCTQNDNSSFQICMEGGPDVTCHPYSVTLITPLFCNVSAAVSHLSLCILTSSKAATYNTFIFDFWDPLFLLLFWEKMSSSLRSVYKWCFDPALLLFSLWIEKKKKTWIRLADWDNQIYCNWICDI